MCTKPLACALVIAGSLTAAAPQFEVASLDACRYAVEAKAAEAQPSRQQI
jgi:hypothetical protein